MWKNRTLTFSLGLLPYLYQLCKNKAFLWILIKNSETMLIFLYKHCPNQKSHNLLKLDNLLQGLGFLQNRRRAAFIRLYSFISTPNYLFGYFKRLCRMHWFLPFQVVQLILTEQCNPFAPPSLQRLHHYYKLLRPCVVHWYSHSRRFPTWISSLTSQRQVLTFHTRA